MDGDEVLLEDRHKGDDIWAFTKTWQRGVAMNVMMKVIGSDG